MAPNGPDRIQGIGPDVDAKAIKKEVEEALTQIFKKHKLDYFQSRYIMNNIINIEECSYIKSRFNRK